MFFADSGALAASGVVAVQEYGSSALLAIACSRRKPPPPRAWTAGPETRAWYLGGVKVLSAVICVVLIGGCDEKTQIVGNGDCSFSVTLEGGLPDGAAFHGGMANGGICRIDECAVLCGGSGILSCAVVAGSEPLQLSCSPPCDYMPPPPADASLE